MMHNIFRTLRKNQVEQRFRLPIYLQNGGLKLFEFGSTPGNAKVLLEFLMTLEHKNTGAPTPSELEVFIESHWEQADQLIR